VAATARSEVDVRQARFYTKQFGQAPHRTRRTDVDRNLTCTGGFGGAGLAGRAGFLASSDFVAEATFLMVATGAGNFPVVVAAIVESFWPKKANETRRENY